MTGFRKIIFCRTGWSMSIGLSSAVQNSMATGRNPPCGFMAGSWTTRGLIPLGARFLGDGNYKGESFYPISNDRRSVFGLSFRRDRCVNLGISLRLALRARWLVSGAAGHANRRFRSHLLRESRGAHPLPTVTATCSGRSICINASKESVQPLDMLLLPLFSTNRSSFRWSATLRSSR